LKDNEASHEQEMQRQKDTYENIKKELEADIKNTNRKIADLADWANEKEKMKADLERLEYELEAEKKAHKEDIEEMDR
jgi:hypothetical protein